MPAKEYTTSRSPQWGHICGFLVALEKPQKDSPSQFSHLISFISLFFADQRMRWQDDESPKKANTAMYTAEMDNRKCHSRSQNVTTNVMAIVAIGTMQLSRPSWIRRSSLMAPHFWQAL